MRNIEINGKIYQNPLLVFALEVEAGTEFDDFKKIFTGVGKINAAYHLFKGIQKYNPDIVSTSEPRAVRCLIEERWFAVINLYREIWM